MARLEEITRGASIQGILPEALVTVIAVKCIGTVAIEVTYKDSTGRLGNELLYRDREPPLEVVRARNWFSETLLATHLVDGERPEVRHVRQSLHREPDFAAASVDYAVDEHLEQGE